MLKVLEKEVIVDIGYKSEGVIDSTSSAAATASSDQGRRQVDVLLEKTEDGHGYVVLSKEKAERLKVWDVPSSKAYETGEPVDGPRGRPHQGRPQGRHRPARLPAGVAGRQPARAQSREPHRAGSSA